MEKLIFALSCLFLCFSGSLAEAPPMQVPPAPAIPAPALPTGIVMPPPIARSEAPLAPEGPKSSLPPVLAEQVGNPTGPSNATTPQPTESGAAIGAQHGEVELYCENLNPDGTGKSAKSFSGTAASIHATFAGMNLSVKFKEQHEGADVYEIRRGDVVNLEAVPVEKTVLSTVEFKGQPLVVFGNAEHRITLRANTVGKNNRAMGTYTGNTSVGPGTVNLDSGQPQPYRAITQNILTKVAALKGQFPILEKLQVPEVAANGEATLEFEHGVQWVLDDPTQKASKTNGRRAVFEKDGLHFRLHFYRGRWEGAAMFIPVNFGDLNLWFTYEYRQGDDPAIIVAISKIIEEEKRSHTRVEVREVRKQDDKVEISVIDDTLFVDVTSPSGIGGTRLALTSGEWMKKVVVRLKYSADKPFSNLEGPEATLEELEARHDLAAIHLNVRRLEKKDGFEADLPIGVHQKGSKVLHLRWIDAYRN